MINVKRGDLITLKALETGTKGYQSFPGEYGHHIAVWVKPGIGIILEVREEFVHALLNGGMVLWFDCYKVNVIK